MPLDAFSPQTPITEDEKRAGPWFQRWCGSVGDAINPSWQPWTPVCTGATLSNVEAVFRDRGNHIDVGINANVQVVAPIQFIDFNAPILVNGFGVIPGVWTPDFASYRCVACYYNPGVNQIRAQKADGTFWAPFTGNIAIYGNYQKIL